MSAWPACIDAAARSPAAQVMWKVVKPWIHPITRSKIELVGARYEESCSTLELLGQESF